MAEPFLSEIRLMSFQFAPKGWALCDGQILPIAQNQALFALLGATYGGNGATNFALPDLRGRMPMHAGRGHALGEKSGASTHTLTTSELPSHTHAVLAGATATELSPSGAFWASPGKQAFGPTPSTRMSQSSVTNAGGSQPHENMSPYLTLNFAIALVGIFPSQT